MGTATSRGFVFYFSFSYIFETPLTSHLESAGLSCCVQPCVVLSHCVLFIVKAILKLGVFHFLVCSYLVWNITLNFFILASFSNMFTYLFSLNAFQTKSLCHQEYSNFHITLLNWPVPVHPL